MPAIIAVLLLQILFFSAKGVAEYAALEAQGNPRHEAAIKANDFAFKLDPNNPALMISSASRHAAAGDYRAAAEKMRTAIENGMGVPTTYSTMAEFQLIAGLPDEAVKTLNEATRIFPRSVFLRTRLAVLREDSGDAAAAGIEMRVAENIDPRQTAGWYNLFRKGGLVAFLEARDTNIAAKPAELVPQSIVPQFLKDRVEVSKR